MPGADAQVGIGGALFINPVTFQVVQVLEGPASAVNALFEKISRDLRHEQACRQHAPRCCHASTPMARLLATIVYGSRAHR